MLRSCELDVTSMLASQREREGGDATARAGLLARQKQQAQAALMYMEHPREYTAGIDAAYRAASKVLLSHGG